MVSKILLFLAICSSSLSLYAKTVKFPFAGVTVELLDSADAAKANSISDAYSRALTPFDLQIRLGILTGATEKDYLARAATQVRNWPAQEQQELKKSFAEIEAFLKAHHISLKLPASVQMIKTNGREEFEAEGYTRENRISLHINDLQELNTHLVAHELFHVYSRYNEARHDKIYAIFGFKKCNPINAAQAMQNRVITNPDCPVIQHYLTLKVDDKKPVDMVLQLFSKKDYQEGYTLGDYMNLGLLAIEGTDKNKKPIIKNGKGIVYEIDEVPDLFHYISNNTSYILHPEEISAEHFAMWITGKQVPQPAYFEQLKAALQ